MGLPLRLFLARTAPRDVQCPNMAQLAVRLDLFEESPVSQENLDAVQSAIREALEEEGKPVGELNEDTDILSETELDSLGLSLVVVKLEEKTGKDPFSEGFINFRTIGELAKLFDG